MKTAIVHDYFYQNGGAEKVVEIIYKQFPESHIYTALYYPEMFRESEWLTDAVKQGKVHTSFAQYIVAHSLGIRFFKHFFWLYPIAMALMVVKGYDTVIISSSYCAKNVRVVNAGKIIHYCHSPARFLHNMARETDMKSVNALLRSLVPLFTWWLKALDVAGARRLTRQGALWYVNALHMKDIVRDAYSVEPEVLYPPVDVAHFKGLPKSVNKDEPYYLYFGRISFHKRIDVLIDACARAGRRLYICGGAGLRVELDTLMKQVDDLDKQYPGAKERIQFLGRLGDQERDRYIQGAYGFLFAGKEDFGIAPIEALASGTPLLMYQAGGALDYLQDGVNGVFSPEQTAESFVQAIERFETYDFDHDVVRATTERFSTEYFTQALQNEVKKPA